MNLKKLVVAVLTLSMVFGALCISAYAAETSVATAEDFYNAVKNANSGDVINLSASVTFTEAWSQIWSKNGITINGNGNTVTFEKPVTSNGNGDVLLYQLQNSTVKDLTLVFPEDDTTSGVSYAGNGCTFSNVTVKNGKTAIYNSGAVTITGCTFENQSYIAIYSDDSGNTNGTSVTDCTFVDTRAYIARSNEMISGNEIVLENKDSIALAMTIAPSATATLTENILPAGTELEFFNSASTLKENQILGTVVVSDNSNLDLVDLSNNQLSDAAASTLSTATGSTVTSTSPVAVIGEKEYLSLQTAVDAAKDGETVTLLGNCAENVTVTQKPNVKITIDGANKTYTGTFTIDGKSQGYETAGVTIKNFNFDATSIPASPDVCISLGGNNNIRYVSNVTVQDCTFTDDNYTAAGIKSYTGGDKNLTITGCTATGMHSLAQLYNTADVTISGCVVNAKNGISLRQSTNVSISDTTITATGADGYGIRVDGKDNGSAALENVEINAWLPLLMRNATGDYTLTVEGDETAMMATGPHGAIVSSSGDVDVTHNPAEPADTATITIFGGTYSSDISEFCADNFTLVPNQDGSYGVFPDADTYYITATAAPADSGAAVTGTGLYALGQTATLTATAPEGYRFVKWTENGVDVSTDPTISFPVLEAHHFIAVFEQDPTEFWLWMYLAYMQKFTVNASATEGGTISPAGETSVKYGSSVTFTLTPDAGYQIKALLVNGEDKGALSSYTIEKVTKNQMITAVFEKIEVTLPFTDVKTDAWYYDDVAYVYAAGLMNGTDKGFEPTLTLNRAMLVTTLWRLAGEPTASASDFTDVKAGEWYTAAINWAAANKIVNGYEGKFDPEGAITREQVMAILHRFADFMKYESKAGVDGKHTTSDWAVDDVAWANANGILTDIGVDITDMTAEATRAEIAAYLARFAKTFVK